MGGRGPKIVLYRVFLILSAALAAYGRIYDYYHLTA